MILDIGEGIHIIERRRFETGVRRHFAGRVDRVDGMLVRATGHTYAFDPGRRVFDRRATARTRVISLGDAGLIVNVLPPSVEPGDLVYRWAEDGTLAVHDRSWSMDLTEFVWSSS